MKYLLTLFILLLTISSFPDENDKIRFLHITDLHADFIGIMYPKSSHYLSKLKEIVIKTTPLFVISSGDNVEFGERIFGEKNYLTLTNMFFKSNDNFYVDENLSTQIYFVPGNHEYHSITKITCTDIPNYRKFIGKEFYSLSYGNFLFIFLNTGYDYYWKPFDYNGLLPDPEGSGLSKEQLEFLERALNSKSNFIKVIITHHPPVNYNSSIEDGIFLNNKEFLEICNKYDVNIFISGHTHKDKIYIYDGTNTQLLRLSEPTNITYDSKIFIQTPSFGWEGAYRIIELNSNYITIYPVEKIKN